MTTNKNSIKSDTKKQYRPTTNPEAQKNLCINLAMNLAEKQLREGTASSQVITHYLKLGTEKERLENERLSLELELVKAKTESLRSTKHIEELYSNALSAMKRYGGSIGDSDSINVEDED